MFFFEGASWQAPGNIFPGDQETGRRRFLFTIIFHWLQKCSVAGLVIRFCAKVERSGKLLASRYSPQILPTLCAQNLEI